MTETMSNQENEYDIVVAMEHTGIYINKLEFGHIKQALIRKFQFRYNW